MLPNKESRRVWEVIANLAVNKEINLWQHFVSFHLYGGRDCRIYRIYWAIQNIPSDK